MAATMMWLVWSTVELECAGAFTVPRTTTNLARRRLTTTTTTTTTSTPFVALHRWTGTTLSSSEALFDENDMDTLQVSNTEDDEDEVVLVVESAPRPGADGDGNSVEATTPISPSPQQQSDVAMPDTYVRCGKCQTVYPITEDDVGRGRGRRLECSVCSHSWFQSKDRLMNLKDGYEMIPLPSEDLTRIAANIEQGKPAGFVGEVKIYVGNVAFECHEDDIMAEFSKIGPVGDVSLVRDEEGRNRGFGFVTMRSKEDGQRAIEALDGAPVRGRKIAVRESSS
jgi:predicted Zn finger-like uncharacterized protein